MLHGRLAVTFASFVLTAHSPARLPDSWADSSLRAVTRLVCNRRKHDHITPLLHDVLHWLPVPFRIEYKLCVLVFLSLTELLQSTDNHFNQWCTGYIRPTTSHHVAYDVQLTLLQPEAYNPLCHLLCFLHIVLPL